MTKGTEHDPPLRVAYRAMHGGRRQTEEGRRSPSADAEVERLTRQLTKVQTQLDKLSTYVEQAKVTENFAKLNDRIDRAVGTLGRFDELLKKHLNIHDGYHEAAFERLDFIVDKLIPDIHRDLAETRKILGKLEDRMFHPPGRRNH